MMDVGVLRGTGGGASFSVERLRAANLARQAVARNVLMEARLIGGSSGSIPILFPTMPNAHLLQFRLEF
jgi:hypothetical protein